jgi:hypothetical protein
MVWFMLLVTAGFGLSGCSSGGDGGGQTTNLSFVGLWDGLFLGNPFGAESATAMIQGGRFMMVDNNDVVYDGSYEANGSTGFLAQQVRRTNAAGSAGQDLSITGTVRSDNQFGQLLTLRITVLGSTNIPDDLQLIPNPVYQQASGMAQVEDFWMANADQLSFFIFNIQDISGNNITADDNPCFYSGVMSTLNAQRNLYSVNIFVSTPLVCAISGQYSGFAALYNDGNLLRLILASENRGLHFLLERQQ